MEEFKDYEIGKLICDYITDHSLISWEETDEDDVIMLYFTQSSEEQIGAKVVELLKLRRIYYRYSMLSKTCLIQILNLGVH